MAIYKLASGASRILGSRQGSTFQRCGVNFAIRQRKKPFPRRTARTSRSRSAFHNVQAHYRTLSAGNKTSWDDDVGSFPRTDSLGNTYELSGSQLFNAHNATLVNQDLSIIDISQAPVTFPTFDSFAKVLSVGSQDFEFTYGVSGTLTNFDLQLFVSRPLAPIPPAVASQASLLIASKQAMSSTVFQIYNEYVARFGDPANLVDQFIVTKMKALDRSSGQVSTLFITASAITS